mgnify:CR=1 FL=1
MQGQILEKLSKNFNFLNIQVCLFVSRVGWVPGLPSSPFACVYLQISPKSRISSAPLLWFGNPDNTIQENLIKSLVQIQWHRKKEAGPHCLCAARWNNVTTVRVTMTNHLCLMHPHTTTMYNYILYTKARYLQKAKAFLEWRSLCHLSREMVLYQLAHQVCKTRQTRQWKLRAYKAKAYNYNTG